jgi:hypothetical protein
MILEDPQSFDQKSGVSAMGSDRFQPKTSLGSLHHLGFRQGSSQFMRSLTWGINQRRGVCTG